MLGSVENANESPSGDRLSQETPVSFDVNMEDVVVVVVVSAPAKSLGLVMAELDSVI